MSNRETARRFLDALGRRDFTTIRSLLAPDVWLRALLARKVVEAKSADDAVATFGEWVRGGGLEVMNTEDHPMEGRHHVRYRLRLQPYWAPDQWHTIEQTGFLKIVDGSITRVDLVCSGYSPEAVEEEHSGAAA